MKEKMDGPGRSRQRQQLCRRLCVCSTAHAITLRTPLYRAKTAHSTLTNQEAPSH